MLLRSHTLRLPRSALRRRVPLAALFRSAFGRPASPENLHAFKLAPYELRFADALTDRHPRFWVYRSHQRRFCGDFFVVDMSSPQPKRRRSWAIDLKRGSRLRRCGSIQLRNRDQATAELVEAGVIGPSTVPEPLLGDRTAVLCYITRTLKESPLC